MIIWFFSLIALLFLVLSWKTAHSSKPVNLWANDKSEINVKDVKRYNFACAKLLA